jgi:hypothetical protein
VPSADTVSFIEPLVTSTSWLVGIVVVVAAVVESSRMANHQTPTATAARSGMTTKGWRRRRVQSVPAAEVCPDGMDLSFGPVPGISLRRRGEFGPCFGGSSENPQSGCAEVGARTQDFPRIV